MKTNGLSEAAELAPSNGAMHQTRTRLRAIWAGLIVAVVGCSSAQAALVDHGVSTFDSIASREWLDLTQSQHLSYNDMTGAANNCNPTCTTGAFAGWTFAAEADVKSFMANAGLAPYSSTGDESSALNGALSSFRSLVGETASFPFGSYSDGISRTIVGPDEVLRVSDRESRSLICLHCGFGFGSAGTERATVSALAPFAVVPGSGFGPGGVWLYQTVAVPEPETVAMLLAGLGLLGFTVRRKQR